MKNKPVVITIIVVFLGIIVFDQFGKYLINENLKEKDKKYEETLKHVDSTLFIVDKQISKRKALETEKKNSIKKIDSLTDKINNQTPEVQYITDVQYVTETLHVSPKLEKLEMVKMSEFKIAEPITKLKDSVVYNYIEIDSIIYIYDTINMIHIDTILITDPKIIKKIKRKYLD